MGRPKPRYAPACVCVTHASWNRPLIGAPLPNVEFAILNETERPIAVGETGELFIGGIGVANGYLGQPDLTARKFVKMLGGRFFRTGDLVKRHEDETLEFVGRVDRQFKARGSACCTRRNRSRDTKA